MKNQTAIETILTGIAVFFLLLFLIVMPIDILNFYEDQETYIKVHHLNTHEKNWEWQYLDTWVYLGLYSITGLTIITLRQLKKDHKMIEIINRLFLIFFYGVLIIGFYRWMSSGFDH
ncbi:MAG: hypothetical protein ACK5RG_14890 [Cyclobacteriaceae bacterium]|jgi:hypothetical protein|nr:hypothetical protein [Flammeovirgaceae bacterium]